ncbi:MAG: 1,4-alpha-glucan branching protein domain-containing protein [Candidatus Zixiibacteriota bacterium]
MNIKPIGSFALVLHSHLPYVIAHGKWPHGMDWLNEASAETYIPVLNVLNELVTEGHSPKLTIGITPVLCEQLADEAFKQEFSSYLLAKITAAEKDIQEFAKHERKLLLRLGQMWKDYYARIKSDFETKYDRDIISHFKKLQDAGHIEIITCAATHGYLPLLSQDTSVQAQMKQAVQSYTQHFGRPPRGTWLPECAYRPRYKWTPPLETGLGKESYLRKGIEEFVSENGMDYFFIDSALLKGGKAIGVYMDRFDALKTLWGQFQNEYAPREEEIDKTPREVYLVGTEGKKPVAIFTRDPDTGLQVWSGEWGYPGDGNYLDFHKKHFPGGHRYWKITAADTDLADKLEYFPDDAQKRIPENASHFKELIKKLLNDYHKETGKHGLVCAPYDAELFGHWWFEGTEFLKLVLKYVSEDPEIELTTCSDFLGQAKPSQVISIPEGSWGEGGYHYIWLNEWTDWTWKHIYQDEIWMQRLVQEFGESKDEKLISILKQVARELFLLQASDWQFLISTWSARDYAELRLSEHHQNFVRLAEMAEKYGREEPVDLGEWAFLGDVEARDNLFKDVDYRWFGKLEFPPR